MSKSKKRMNNSLPKTTLFPRIYRFITEEIFVEKHLKIYKIFIVSFFSGILLIAIGFESALLLKNLDKAKQAVKEKENTIWEIAYWKRVADTYKGYRDIYHRLAVLEYKLGNNGGSKKDVQKSLELDPNFEEGRSLGAKVGM